MKKKENYQVYSLIILWKAYITISSIHSNFQVHIILIHSNIYFKNIINTGLRWYTVRLFFIIY